MSRDRFDILIGVALAAVIAVMALLAVRAGLNPGATTVAGSKAAERALQQRAQAALLAETYAPVETLLAAGKSGEALLQLEQIERQLPGEAHTALLRGEVLLRQGAQVEGIREVVRAVKLRADYVDAKSPLQRRGAFEALLATALPELQRKAQAAPDNPSFGTALRDLHYLQSRLAGGCE